MKKWLGQIFIFFLVVGSKINLFASDAPKGLQAASLYDFTVKSIEGKEVALKEFAGKVLLIVNTASRCGFTSQYEGLEALQKKYGPRGFVVLGFPSNDFGSQEPGSNADIQQFCRLNYAVSFPLFEKGPVSGEAIQPLFAYLTGNANPKHKGRILWNFEKFLIDRNGRLIERFRSVTSPESKSIIKAIEAAL
jgi:glutathione peroxidase